MPPDSAVDAEALLASEIQELGSDVIGLQEVDYFLGRSNNHNQTGNVATVRQADEHYQLFETAGDSPPPGV